MLLEHFLDGREFREAVKAFCEHGIFRGLEFEVFGLVFDDGEEIETSDDFEGSVEDAEFKDPAESF